MTTLACLAMAGLALGIFFNAYALLTVCLLMILAYFASAFHAGFGLSLISMVLGLIVIQVAYFIGQSVPDFVFASRSAHAPTPRS